MQIGMTSKIIYVAGRDMRTVKNMLGVTLVETLLVLTIASSVILLFLNYTNQKVDELRRDKTVLQIQQIMSAALSYYVNNSKWPSLTTCSTSTTPVAWKSIPSLLATDSFSPGKGYLTAGFGANPYGKPYQINCGTQSTSDGGNFYVATDTGGSKALNALTIAGRLPMAYITTPAQLAVTTVFPPAQDAVCKQSSPTYPDPTCTVVVSSVSLPGQNLNNARSVNFAGLYYSGSCVPAPNCPPGMKASILVFPASVAGVTDKPTNCNDVYPYDPATEQCSVNLYSLQSFSAFARGGDSSGNPVLPGTGGGWFTGGPFSSGNGGPYDCSVTKAPANESCWSTFYDQLSEDNSTKYWRVCLVVMTEKGQAYDSTINVGEAWGEMIGQVVAITRCVPNNGLETPVGSTRYEPNRYDSNTNTFVP